MQQSARHKFFTYAVSWVILIIFVVGLPLLAVEFLALPIAKFVPWLPERWDGLALVMILLGLFMAYLYFVGRIARFLDHVVIRKPPKDPFLAPMANLDPPVSL